MPGAAAELLAQRSYRSGFGFHSRASFCASAICSGGHALRDRVSIFLASLFSCAADKSSHMYAWT